MDENTEHGCEFDDMFTGDLFADTAADLNKDNLIIKYDEYHRNWNSNSVKKSEQCLVKQGLTACNTKNTFDENRIDLPRPYRMIGYEVLRLALVAKHHSLWAEFIYNASRVLGDMIDFHTQNNDLLSVNDDFNQFQIDCNGKTCLELGAGAGLPGVLAALNGASVVVISDYVNTDDKSLLKAIDINLEYVETILHENYQNTVCINVAKLESKYFDDETDIRVKENNTFDNALVTNTTNNLTVEKKVELSFNQQYCISEEKELIIHDGKRVVVVAGVGYTWGNPTDELIKPLQATGDKSANTFDLIFLADLIFNRYVNIITTNVEY